MNKRTLLFLRFILILTTILVMTYAKKGLNPTSPGYIIALVYFISNFIFYYLPEKFFTLPYATFGIFLFDIIIISLAIYFTQGMQTDFYLIYFLVIFIASVGQDIGGSLPIAVVASILYGWLIYRSRPGISLLDSAILIRVPFLFIISLISSYWSSATRKAIKEKEELERFNIALKKEVARVAAQEIEMRKYFEKIINSVSSGVIAVREDGVITTINPEAARVLRLSKEEAEGINIKNIEGFNKFWERMAQVMASGKTVKRDEVLIMVEKNKTIPVGFSISPITGVEHRFSGCVVILKDLSEIKALEQKLKHAERLTYLGKMASWVAHEIRNPLTSIDGFAQLLSETEEPERIKKFSAEILKGAQRINNIIDDILTFGRSKRIVEPIEIKLKPLIESIVKDFRNIKITIDGIEPVVQGEPESIRRLFVNLINNACEAMREDGVLKIKFSQDDDFYITEIVDNGKGIPEENLKNLFTPFFTTKQRGTGLGLAIVKKILDDHEGKIEITSKENVGTTCRIYLPKVLKT